MPRRAMTGRHTGHGRGRARTSVRGLFRLALSAGVSVCRRGAGDAALHHRVCAVDLRDLSRLPRCRPRHRRRAQRIFPGGGVSSSAVQLHRRAERLSDRSAARRRPAPPRGGADPRRRLPRPSDVQAASRSARPHRADRRRTLARLRRGRHRRRADGGVFVRGARRRRLAGVHRQYRPHLSGLPVRRLGRLRQIADGVRPRAHARRQRAASLERAGDRRSCRRDLHRAAVAQPRALRHQGRRARRRRAAGDALPLHLRPRGARRSSPSSSASAARMASSRTSRPASPSPACWC
mgnify:CR=1 FL=1